MPNKYTVKTFYMGRRESEYYGLSLTDIQNDHASINPESVDKISLLRIGESYDFDLTVNLMLLVCREE